MLNPAGESSANVTCRLGPYTKMVHDANVPGGGERNEAVHWLESAHLHSTFDDEYVQKIDLTTAISIDKQSSDSDPSTRYHHTCI